MTGNARSGVFGVPPGADFPRALVAGLIARFGDDPPEALARVTLYVNTQRMARRITEVFAEGPARLLPRLRVITDLGTETATGLPPSTPALRRQLELRRLVEGLIAAQPDLAPRESAFDLAVSLAALMDEMQGEGVALSDVTGIDTGGLSEHWARSVAFLDLVGRFLDATGDASMDPEARQRRVVEETLAHWQAAPPEDPIVVAGSTGSRGTTAMFMAAVARLPAGAVVLPGLDGDMPEAVWRGLSDPVPLEDHPQYRHAAFAARAGIDPWAIPAWADTSAPDPARNRLVSLALRPAPVTDAWRREGPSLGCLVAATAGLSLVEATDPRQEALAIALRLRRALDEGKSAALISPDRALTRRVTAALARWRIRPDDSAGEPLRQSAAGRLIRQVAALFGQPLTAEALIALLKHPLVHRGAGRNTHLLATREFEVFLRRRGVPFPGAGDLAAWLGDDPPAARATWADWVVATCLGHAAQGAAPLPDLVARLTGTLTSLAAGSEAGATPEKLWSGPDGEEARRALTELGAEAGVGGTFDPAGFATLLSGVLGREVREAAEPDPRVRIWGTLEARVQGTDLAILAGLNDGVWPDLPDPDPWLNRRMRAQAGLLMPERRIGLAAHDFQQAVAAPEVMLTRAARDGEAPTVPSRWLNRLTNLLAGLEAQGGKAALAAMRARGAAWSGPAARLDRPAATVPRAKRPAPQPPVAHRPDRLSVTQVETLIRDPYAIYAAHILRLAPLDPLRRSPDARERGTVLHGVMERAVPGLMDQPEADRPAALIAAAEAALAETIPWAAARRLWRARIARIATAFCREEAARQTDAEIVALERRGRLEIAGCGVALTAKADRIDRAADGTLRIYDYKTGSLPSVKQLKTINKQLLLEALMAERGAFEEIPAAPVTTARYLRVAAKLEARDAPIAESPAAATEAQMQRLLAAYADPDTGYRAQEVPETAQFSGDYLLLARAGEWDLSVLPTPERVGW